MKDLKTLYEHLQSANDEANEQGLYQFVAKIGEMQLIIEEFRAETTEQKQPCLKD